MQRARRLVPVAVVAVLVTGGLSACRSEPSVAAYLGSTRITQERVDAVYRDAERKRADAVARAASQQGDTAGAQQAPQDTTLSFGREEVLEALIGAELLPRLARERRVTPVQVPADQVAQSLDLPPDAEFVGIYSTYRSNLSALVTAATPAEVSDADMRDVYDRFKAAGGLGPNPVPFEEFTSQLGDQDLQVVGRSIAVREDLTKAYPDLDASVNPRYSLDELPLLPITIQRGATANLVGMPLGGPSGEPAVRDLS